MQPFSSRSVFWQATAALDEKSVFSLSKKQKLPPPKRTKARDTTFIPAPKRDGHSIAYNAATRFRLRRKASLQQNNSKATFHILPAKHLSAKGCFSLFIPKCVLLFFSVFLCFFLAYINRFYSILSNLSSLNCAIFMYTYYPRFSSLG